MTVTPIFGQPLCYHVGSRSNPNQAHFVNLADFNGNGSCGCSDWSCRCVANMKRPHDLLTDATLCAHLRAAHLFNLSVQIECILAK